MKKEPTLTNQPIIDKIREIEDYSYSNWENNAGGYIKTGLIDTDKVRGQMDAKQWLKSVYDRNKSELDDTDFNNAEGWRLLVPEELQAVWADLSTDVKVSVFMTCSSANDAIKSLYDRED